jgi:hypothetical protein
VTMAYLRHRGPDVPSDQREAAEAVKRILKLRWIGDEDAARELELIMRRSPLVGGPSVLSEPFDTD